VNGMGPFGEMVTNSGNVLNVPVYAVFSVPAYTFHESTSPWAEREMLTFANYFGIKRRT